MRKTSSILILGVVCFLPLITFGQLVINEFSSKGSIKDFDGKTNDWIELINTSSNPINLSNYFISDNINNMSKWQLPEIEIDSMQKILILCSGKDIKERISHWESIINEYTFFKYFVGTQEPDSNWRSDINDSTWLIGQNGIGFGDNDDSTIITNTKALYLRYEFDITNKADITKLLLHADYDDSFVAYINGIEIARSNNIFGTPITHQTLATSEHEAFINSGEINRYCFNKLQLDSLLEIGNNILAIQIHDFDSIPDDMSARFFLHTGVHSDTIYFNSPINWLNEEETYYHTNFKLSQGEEIIISDNNGNIIDQKIIHLANTSYSEGRIPDGLGNWCYISSPTPNETNNGLSCYNGVAEEPLISLNSGWYLGQQYTTITSFSNTQVFYTTNGDVPDTNDHIYSDTLSFDSTTVLSVRAFSLNNLLPSKVVDRTYIINEDNYGLPVFSIITDSLNLWDWDTGIYVLGPNANSSSPYYGANFWQNWSKWSRLEFFDKNRNKQAEEEFDLEIFGGWSRQKPQKSFTLDFKSRYTGDFDWPIISDKPYLNKFNNINLRNGGSKTIKDRIRDPLSAKLSSGTNIDVMGYEPCIVYLNGKYWGSYGIREKMDEHYIQAHHGINSDSLDIINAASYLPRVYAGSETRFVEVYHTLMNTDPTSTYFFNYLKSKFDIKNLIDYFIVETYIGNIDWLYNGAKNLKLWRSHNKNSKWRYLLYDTDAAFWTSPYNDSFNESLNPLRPNKHSELFEKFLQNDMFNCKFGKRYMDLANTIFDKDYIHLHIDSLKDEIYDAMPDHITKWGQPLSMQEWENEIEEIKDYAAIRRNSITNDLLQYINASSIISLELNVTPIESGYIKINDALINQYPSNRLYLEDLCVDTIIAIADSGFIFSYWDSTYIIGNQIYNDTINIDLYQNDTIVANFRECRINNLFLNQDSIYNSFSPVFDVGYGPYSFQWFLDNDTIIAAEDSLIYPVMTGSYSVSVTDKDGCNTISPSVFFDCNILVESDLTQDTITNSLHINCLGGTSPYSYQWIYNNDTILNLDDTIHYPLETGYYYFIATDINGCHSLSDSLFTKDCGSVLEPILTQDTITNSLHINCLGGTSPYSYQWFIDSAFIEGIDKSFLNIYTYGTYYSIIEDVNGCKSFTDTISNLKLKVNIFPNPTNRLMNIQFLRLHGEKYTLSIFDLHMNILHYIDLPEVDNNMFYTQTFNLDISRTGLYLIRLESSKNQIAKRFIYIE